ncbi:MAG: bifunctional glutamate N-acetyltransferase/amino-acid acetyltransferase ArgJ [Actinomycetota bacterium]
MSQDISHVAGGVTAPKGFLAAGISCGIKKSGNKDVALVFSTAPARAGALFTTNKVKAAPVLVTKEHLKGGKAQAVVINSGNANCCTGKLGLADASEMANLVGIALNISANDVLVASTGLIGIPLPMRKVEAGISEAAVMLNSKGGSDAAKAIMTTDTFLKETAVQFRIGGKTIKMGGMAKGSGMIAPNLATMLSVVTTDARVEAGALLEAFKEAVNTSFNLITVDGDMSTNDTVIIMANGLAENKEINEDVLGREVFSEALKHVTKELAELIIRDGEGATKFITIEVKGAESFSDAKEAAMTVANSNLVKCAFFGGDPNWGRIMAAIGNSKVKVKPANIDIYFGDEPMVMAGTGVVYCAQTVEEMLKSREIKVTIDLNLGVEKAVVWTTDLTYDYIRLNAEYKT